MFTIQYNKLVTSFMLVVFTLGISTLVGLISKIIVPLLFVGAVGIITHYLLKAAFTSRLSEVA